MQCPICSRLVPDSSGKRGRPAEFCSPACATFNRDLCNVEESFAALVAGIVAERDFPAGGASASQLVAVADIRGRLFVMANEANRIGRPVQGANARHRTKTRDGWRGLKRTDIVRNG